MDEALQGWCKDAFQDQIGKLNFRPFCKWFDKNLAKLFQLSATKVCVNVISHYGKSYTKTFSVTSV